MYESATLTSDAVCKTCTATCPAGRTIGEECGVDHDARCKPDANIILTAALATCSALATFTAIVIVIWCRRSHPRRGGEYSVLEMSADSDGEPDGDVVGDSDGDIDGDSDGDSDGDLFTAEYIVDLGHRPGRSDSGGSGGRDNLFPHVPTQVFLPHNWGTDDLGRDNHDRVVQTTC